MIATTAALAPDPEHLCLRFVDSPDPAESVSRGDTERMKTMNLIRTTAICSLVALGSTAAWADMKEIGKVEVKTELAAFDESNALDYWTDLEQDLGSAITEKLEVTDDTEDDRLVVAINHVMLDGSPVLPDTGEFNFLEGTITVFEGQDDGADEDVGNIDKAGMESYALRVFSQTEGAVAPEGAIVITPSKDDFYNALIEGFAVEVVDNLD